jgi:mono/diheme cytochrome c family protein
LGVVKRRLALALAAAAVVGVVAAFAFGSRDTSPVAAKASSPTWTDVAPIFAEKCAGCHMKGGIAPFSITTARSAAAYAGAIGAMTRLGKMPPWLPGHDSPAYLGQSRRILTPAEKSLIARWVRGGARIGKGGSIKPAGEGSAAPGTTMRLAPAKPYLPKAAVGGLDDYHCFLLEPHLKQDVFVTSAVVRPQQPAIVHHVILFEAAGQNAVDARRLNRESGGNGWTCFGGPGLSETHPTADAATSDRLGAPPWISAWVPGHTTNDLPAGTGVLVHAGAAVVMQVHYNLIHKARLDRSRGLLYLCHKTLADYPSPQTTCDRTVNRPLRIYGVAGHMHLRGVDIRLELDPGTPSARMLLHIPRWHFHWQDAYYLAQPIDASPGDTIRVTCRFDNSAKHQPVVRGKRLAPRYVLWGEGTTDEMCLGLLQVADR